MMQSKLFRRLTVLGVMMLAAGPLVAATTASSSGLALGARYHADHTVFTELPFDDGDLSYMLAYEFSEGDAYWQVAVGYCADVTGSNSVDYVATPQVNLVLKDGIWRAGVGVLFSYIRDDVTGGDWTDLYWQLLVGIRLPLGSLKLGVEAVYPFESWDDVGEFDVDDLEYNGWLGYTF